MPLTFSGTYTKNEGDEAAAGTVTVTHVNGTTDTATLDAAGSYTLELATSGGTVTIVETLDGAPAHTFKTGVTEGAAIDTSRDLGRVGLTQSGASVDWSAVEVAAVSITATGTGEAIHLLASADGGIIDLGASGAGGAIQIQADDVRIFLKSPNGTAYKIVVADDGTLSAQGD